MTYYSFTSFW